MHGIAVGLLARVVHAVDLGAGILRVPVVARVRDGVGADLVTVPVKVVRDALAVGVVDDGDLRGNVVVVADVAGRLVEEVIPRICRTHVPTVSSHRGESRRSAGRLTNIGWEGPGGGATGEVC
jgi:hypothetical protein